MLTGSHAINMDAKGRMAIPAKVRDSLATACAGRLVLTAHPDERCLLVYPEPQWDEVLANVQSLPNSNRAVRRVQRLLMGYATPVEMDSNGRIPVSPTLRSYAGLDKKLMLVGLGDKLELWSEDAWLALLDEPVDDELPDVMQSLSF
ncbi:division/cell wall cluster transcriptional repressor MraZ [Marinimicrobium alkaliphilum]|uniref:division/cell wall cluster transcriptional repressor MraZ n=1 Tax=Marinimicrobium alkaliphilum TaxID=2202654 RepID=UPI000DB9BBD0|nr:division/cell wall cluster transcriptional repressor MraZ [Marinimicrobium alkaliphilum]